MSHTFTPFTLRDLTLRNRLVVPAMCQYSAQHGFANDWHLVNLGRFAAGGFGFIGVEAAAVLPEGRISYADLGIWSNEQIPALHRITSFIRSQGSASFIQLAHAGRKASTPVPWRKGVAETEQEKLDYAYEHWTPLAPSAEPHAEGFQTPTEMTLDDIERTIKAFADAAIRADKAGFDAIELHGAHGYLINQFLSPLGNKRTDNYGGNLENRMRFALEVTKAVRDVWPESKPLMMRLSVKDWHEDGWTTEDSIALVRRLKALGVDLIDCSSGGFAGAPIKVEPLYQVDLAEAVKKATDVPTIAVGLITTAEQAEGILAEGRADFVGLARKALDDPNFAIHAAKILEDADTSYALAAKQAGYAIRGMDRSMRRP